MRKDIKEWKHGPATYQRAGELSIFTIFGERGLKVMTIGEIWAIMLFGITLCNTAWGVE
jgi:hypothetical protein